MVETALDYPCHPSQQKARPSYCQDGLTVLHFSCRVVHPVPVSRECYQHCAALLSVYHNLPTLDNPKLHGQANAV
jgi:hypothetical protein